NDISNSASLFVLDDNNRYRVVATPSFIEVAGRNSSNVESYMRISNADISFENNGSFKINKSLPTLDTAAWVLVRENSTGAIKKRNVPVTYSGSYTPTATAGDNVNAVDMVSIAHYMRVGDQVHVYGSLRIDPDDDPGEIAIVYLTLPIASDFDAFTSDCVGYANEWSTSRNTALVLPETISDRAAIMFQIDRTD